jgi:transcriptional regulator with XRE-family HTH domain
MRVKKLQKIPAVITTFTDFRLAMGISQAALAEKVGMSQSAIASYDNNKYRPSAALIREFAKMAKRKKLNVDFDKVFK